MFSIITMASSTTKPVEIVSAMRVRLFKLKPMRYMTPKVPISDRGTATAGITVAGTVRRNKKITRMTRATANTNSTCTSRTVARIDVVRSVSTDTCTDDGKVLCSCGSNFFTRSTTSMTFVPGWR